MSHSREEKIEAVGRVLDVLERLRVECPWDRKQTNQSLRPNTIEEVYELCDALLNEDAPNIKKELGDLLLHIVFYAKIGEEQGRFDLVDVCDALNEKLIFRHPHVFGTVHVNGTDEVLQNWEQLKLKEKGGNKTVLGGVPHSLPSMIKAERIQEKAANVGFDWEDRREVWDKFTEEVKEFQTEVEIGDTDRMTDEMGDIFFALVNAARLYGINPDTALERTNAKFIRRFNYLEAKAKAEGKNLKEMTLEEMDRYWNEAKKSEQK